MFYTLCNWANFPYETVGVPVLVFLVFYRHREPNSHHEVEGDRLSGFRSAPHCGGPQLVILRP